MKTKTQIGTTFDELSDMTISELETVLYICGYKSVSLNNGQFTGFLF